MAPAAEYAYGRAPSPGPADAQMQRPADGQRSRCSVPIAASQQSPGTPHRVPSNWEAGGSSSALLDAILDEEDAFVLSPEQSPDKEVPSRPRNHQRSGDLPPTLPSSSAHSALMDTQSRPRDAVMSTPSSVTGPRGSPTMDAKARPLALGFDAITRETGETLPFTPEDNSVRSRSTDNTAKTSVSSPFSTVARAARPKVRGPRLSVNTSRSQSPVAKDTVKPIAPEMVHWKQVRDHVLIPTPIEERQVAERHARSKKLGLVSKAAGRFGFRQAAESAMGYDRRRNSTFGAFRVMGDNMTQEEKEEASRQRRKFGREIRACLEACSAEETRRRLNRIAQRAGSQVPLTATPASTKTPFSTHQSQHAYNVDTKHTATSLHSSAYHLNPPGPEEVSAFAPLLMELHRHLPDARAKRVWSLTCPHHSAILAELGTSFLPDSSSTDGERAQALEVFGVLVRNWQTESADEELERWLWLCRAMVISDQALQSRGLSLLSGMLRRDGSLPWSMERPDNAQQFISLVHALLSLLLALESAAYATDQHQEIVHGFLHDLGAGVIMQVTQESVQELLGHLEISDTTHGVEEELLWMAVARVIPVDSTMAMWLLDRQAAVLKQFAPLPALPGMPELLRRLRMITTHQFFDSFASLIRAVSDPDVITSIAHVAEKMYADSAELPGHEEASPSYTILLLLLSLNPSTYTAPTMLSNVEVDLRDDGRLANMLLELGQSGKERVAEELVTSFTTPHAVHIIHRLLRSSIADLGKRCIPFLYRRLQVEAQDTSIQPFLRWLAEYHPQLFYKPLFACAAATQVSSLSAPLATVRKLVDSLGAESFWTQADPQMIVIVLVGSVGPRKGKGGNEDDGTQLASVKLGRYAVLLELTLAVKQIKKADTKTRDFLVTLESRLGVMLEIEEKESPLPCAYRSLVCQLLDACRTASRVIKRTAATRLALSWFVADTCFSPAPTSDAEQAQTLETLVSADASAGNSERLTLLRTSTTKSLPSLLVTIQASISAQEWADMLPIVWERYGQPEQPVEQLTFLLIRCAEAARGSLMSIVSAQLLNAGPDARQHTLLKLAELYSYRFQVLTQPTVTDKRGLKFRFAHKTLDFVMTEMGSVTWVPTRDAQDAALQKYGHSLPLELRQRLMQLGWTEDHETTASDIEHVPVSVLPLAAAAPAAPGAQPAISSAPSGKKLDRKASDSSLATLSRKIHRAVIPPDLLSLVMDQGRLLANSGDVYVNTLSSELVRMFEREDATLFVRPVTENLQSNAPLALTRLNGVIAQPTPSFAYVAINSLAGFLKAAVRANPAYPQWPMVLTSIARLVPFASEISLRDVRKSKAEHVLLPASIHEEEGGLKIHVPWQTNAIDVQTAQLVLLASLLQANPRDVYLIKKMLFNLQVQSSMRDLNFARAWLQLVIEQFSAVNSNYNDRAELRHFLSNIVTALTLHGTEDLLVAAFAMRALMLCATRFRRVFASIGFVDIMRTVFQVYVHGHAAIKDAVEYACRSFYRIHQDVFVYQLCLALGEDASDSNRTAYDLVACLSLGDTPQAGVPSGLRDLNQKYEVEALLQMMSGGAQVSLSALGKRAARKEQDQVQVDNSINLDPVVFPRHHIVKLLVTVIAANAATKRAVLLMRLFANFIPYMKDERSAELLEDAVDVIGRFVYKRRAEDDTKMQRLLPGDEGTPVDWETASGAYVRVVDQLARDGGHLDADATRRFLDIVGAALQRPTDDIGATASSALGALARTQLAGKNAKSFLRDLAPAYRQHLATVDFSGVLESITSLIQRSNAEARKALAKGVVQNYVEPAIRMLTLASEDSMAFIVPLRKAAVELLGVAVFLPESDALEVLENATSSPGLLASVILPLTLVVERPAGDRDDIYNGLWVRLIRIVMKPKMPRSLPQLSQAAMAALALQILKIITIRAPDAISSVRGLWTYIAQGILKSLSRGDGNFYVNNTTPRIIDWMMWSLFEMLALHRTPLHLDMRLRIQTILAEVAQGAQSRPSTPGSTASEVTWRNPFLNDAGVRTYSGSARRPSARRPSYRSDRTAISYATAQMSLDDIEEPSDKADVSESKLLPALTVDTSSSSLRPPSLGGESPRTPRFSSAQSSPGPVKPSFSALSARRASRPHFDAFASGGARQRFPSAAPRPGERGAIVHLLGPATMAAATGAGSATSHLGSVQPDALRETLQSSELTEATYSAINTVLGVYGYPSDSPPKTWNLPDALHEITEQSRILIEQEFAPVFSPTAPEQAPPAQSHRLSLFSLASDRASKRSSVAEEKGKRLSFASVGSASDEDRGYTLNHTFDDISPLREKFRLGDRNHELHSPLSRMGVPLSPGRRRKASDASVDRSAAQVPLLSFSHV